MIGFSIYLAQSLQELGFPPIARALGSLVGALVSLVFKVISHASSALFNIVHLVIGSLLLVYVTLFGYGLYFDALHG